MKKKAKRGDHQEGATRKPVWTLVESQTGKGSPQKDSKSSSYNPDRQVWGFQNGEWIRKNCGKTIEQETNPVRTESSKDLVMTRSTETSQEKKELPIER